MWLDTVLDTLISRSNTTTSLNHLLSLTFAVESKFLLPSVVKSDVDARWGCDESDGDVWIGEGLGGVPPSNVGLVLGGVLPPLFLLALGGDLCCEVGAPGGSFWAEASEFLRILDDKGESVPRLSTRSFFGGLEGDRVSAEIGDDTSKTFRVSGCGEGDSSALLYSSLM